MEAFLVPLARLPDQPVDAVVSAQGLAAGLPARIHLRSRPHEALAGRVLRIEPRADAVTEELLAKFDIHGVQEVHTLYINELDQGGYISNTLRTDETADQYLPK